MDAALCNARSTFIGDGKQVSSRSVGEKWPRLSVPVLCFGQASANEDAASY